MIQAAFRSVQDSENTSYLLSDTLHILRTNAGWTTFAMANGGESMLERWGRGASLLDALPEPLRELHRTHLLRTLATGEPWELDYECSSAELYRELRMMALPTSDRFITVTHSPRVCRPHDRLHCAADDERYLQDGILRMCVYCRRVEAAGAKASRWDWVPDYVTAMPINVSHGICPICNIFHASAFGDP